ncbi:YciI family protein [Niallia taxi]|uniref:YCII-related domain-containing protein n=1 Tax=Niallia taxi TaxID=2499688 RepID=A0A437KFV3_9BACI|nr:YciI family protein [Niallia taxi]MCM3214605.1 YciI family protein [Niallia taxi]MDK8642564.1 YciI family protein [Niallia taxi]MED4040292.1 YciI family protein [Niallia taxi]MED4056226.1 YciI family protein [Niallia taxi]MED4119711.1 YciI family protein [Niallia taxi]
MQFVVTAYDGTDENALERRLRARAEHLKSVEKRFKEGNHLYGAALLDDTEKMIGSMMVVDYPSKEALDEWLKEEPYVTGNVWQRIDVLPCKVAPIFMESHK